jgi:methyl-accepting chemotaxis protein
MMSFVERMFRKINVKLRLIVIFSLVLMVTTGSMGLYATSAMSDKILYTAQEKLKSDLALGEELLDKNYPGEWEIVNGLLYKGDVLMEENYEVIDEIGELTGDTVTIFKGDTRVSTNVTQDGERCVGTTVSDIVAEAVLKNNETYIGRAEVVGTMNETAYKPIKDSSGKTIGIWYVGVPATPYDALVDHFRSSMIIFSIIAIIIGIIFSFLISYSVHMPLTRIEEAVKKIGQGDLSVIIPVFAKDEPARLALVVNAMVERMAELVGTTRHLADEVGQSSSQLLKQAENSSRVMENMTMKSTEMSQSAAEQAELTGRSKMVIDEMSVAIQQVAQNAQEVSSSVMNANSTAEDGGKQVEKTISQISTISNTVNSTARIIEGLGSKSQEIGQIVDLITNIANQTNLLALNAAIEAARAGEQGKGFAVVAEEVRKLAEESGEAAKSIADLISEVQNEADKAVNAMEEGTKEVAMGTEVAASAGEAFEFIIKAISQVNEQIQEVSAASQQMAASAETAIEAIDHTTIQAENNSGAAQTINALAEEQMAGVEEVHASIDGLNAVIGELEKSVAYFKI